MSIAEKGIKISSIRLVYVPNVFRPKHFPPKAHVWPRGFLALLYSHIVTHRLRVFHTTFVKSGQERLNPERKGNYQYNVEVVF